MSDEAVVNGSRRAASSKALLGALASLGRRDGAACAVPNRRLPTVLMTAVGHPEGLRSPNVAVGPKGSGFALVSAHHGVEVLAPYSIDVADLHRRERSALDPIRIVGGSWNSEAICSTVRSCCSVMTRSRIFGARAARSSPRARWRQLERPRRPGGRPADRWRFGARVGPPPASRARPTTRASASALSTRSRAALLM